MFYHSLNNMSTLKNMPTPYWGQVVAQGHLLLKTTPTLSPQALEWLPKKYCEIG